MHYDPNDNFIATGRVGNNRFDGRIHSVWRIKNQQGIDSAVVSSYGRFTLLSIQLIRSWKKIKKDA